MGGRLMLANSPKDAPDMSSRAVAGRLKRGLKRRLLGGPAERSENDYATHLPVLIALGGYLPIRRVLELGSGLYSTPAFLDRGAFPYLELLLSIEHDREWGGRVADHVCHDDRFNLTIVSLPVSDALDAVNLDEF